jgi:hypothetical protein
VTCSFSMGCCLQVPIEASPQYMTLNMLAMTTPVQRRGRVCLGKNSATLAACRTRRVLWELGDDTHAERGGRVRRNSVACCKYKLHHGVFLWNFCDVSVNTFALPLFRWGVV